MGWKVYWDVRLEALSGPARGVKSVDPGLSAAARALKPHALRAAGIDEPAGPVETFRRKATVFLAG